jgi:hypothetical protein
VQAPVQISNPIDPDLAELVRHWPTLPPDAQKVILGVARLTPRPEEK